MNEQAGKPQNVGADIRPDIFDRIMALPLLRVFEPFYKARKEVLLYLFFGVLTTLVSILSFALFHRAAGITETIANVPSWILAVLFAYVTNRTWVFASRSSDILPEMAAFFGGRLGSLAVEELILWLFASLLNLNAMAVKITAQIVVVVLNYFISKLLVFRKK